MPIKNLSERRRLPRLGKLHLGIKVQKEGGEVHTPRPWTTSCAPRGRESRMSSA